MDATAILKIINEYHELSEKYTEQHNAEKASEYLKKQLL